MIYCASKSNGIKCHSLMIFMLFSMAVVMDVNSCSKGTAIFCSMTDERLNFASEEVNGVEAYTLQYICKRFNVKNMRKVVRDFDKSDVPFYIGDSGDLSIELYADQTYSIFCDDENIPMLEGLRSHMPVIVLSDSSIGATPTLPVNVDRPRPSGTIIYRIIQRNGQSTWDRR